MWVQLCKRGTINQITFSYLINILYVVIEEQTCEPYFHKISKTAVVLLAVFIYLFIRILTSCLIIWLHLWQDITELLNQIYNSQGLLFPIHNTCMLLGL